MSGIGAEVFQRAPDYDTGEDSIVRVKASELRKRLAQYYQETGNDHEVSIDLLPGGYVPEFRWRTPGVPVEPALLPSRKVSWWMWLVAAAGLALAVFAFLRPLGPEGTHALNRFWEPVLSNEKPALLCVAHPVVYQIPAHVREAMETDPETSIRPRELVADPDHFVGIGDALSLAQISSYLGRRGKSVEVRMGNNASFADLRDSPAVLIGAFSNQWTMQMTANLRYVFTQLPGGSGIQDQMNPTQVWKRDPAKPNADYVLLSRVFDSRTGDMVITAAGIGHIGTQMAGEFLTRPELFEQAVRNAPSDWPQRNMQVVLSGEIIGKTAGPPQVAASWYW